MTHPLTIGTAVAAPGQIVYGKFDSVPLPTGGADFFPVIIAQGRADGPVLWLTGSIHGNEYTGLAVIHRLLGPGGGEFPLRDLRGTVIMVPTLNPAGLRTGSRSPYYLYGADPNRLFPAATRQDGKPRPEADADDTAPTVLERAYERLFAEIEATADYLIDLHNAVIGSLPFAFRDPIYYEENVEGAREAARRLQSTTDAMLEAFGFPVINEFPSAEYLKKQLHRSVSGSVLLKARKPAFTVELSSYLHVNTLARDAAVVGIRNVMRWAGMLPGPRETLPPIPRPAVNFPVRRMMAPRAPQSGIVTHLVQEGDVIQRGQAVARLTDIFGRPLGPDGGLIRAEHDGYVVGLMQGIVFYENEPVIWMAVRDSGNLLLPYPADY